MAADLVVSFAVKIGELVFVPIGKSFSYLYDYNKNLISFQTRVPALENTKTEIQSLVDEAKRNGEHILPQVAERLTSADGMVDESRNFLGDQQGSPSCSNVVSRYRISKKAKKRTLAVNKLLEDGKFDRVSRQVPPPLWSASTGDVETFDSRNLTFKAIMDALKDDTINVIGVYGMGGVGKTTLVKEVAKQAGEQKLFDEMVMSVISQTLNVRNIQGEIADKLGLKLEQESESGRATRLCERLKQSTSVLLILDDVWRLLDLGAIGIPHNDVHKGCKLLLTSRSKDVCYEMNAQVCVPVNVLSKLDAWNLFSKMANITNNSDVHLLATKVAERCAGLPIAVVTVARALRGKSKHAWSDALGQLQSPPPRNIKGMQKYVYSSLELSYNFLETDEIKSCFLLCSLFKEDVEIPIEMLVRYGMGLRLFQNVYTLEAARDRAYALVESLKACCLLLDGKNEEYVRMHDVIRDFAILVASSGQTMYLVRHDVQSFGGHTGEPLTPFAAVSLASTNIAELPGGLDCPKLEILLLQFHSDSIQIPGNFFEGMKELKVVSMSDMPILSLPWSVKYLWKMRTLCLERCKLRDMSSIGELKSLEILSFVGSNVKRLPEEVGQLTRLRLLDLTDCEELTTIPPNVLSKLTSLESLNMMNSFVNWSGEDKVDMQGNNPSLSELKMLSRLRSLEVNILDVNLIPRDLLLENLIKFKIYVGSYWLVSLTHRYSTALKLRIDEGTISLPHCITLLLKQAQYLILEYCPQVLKNVLYNMRREHFQNLRGLVLYGNSDIECIVDTEICKPGVLFPSLEKLEVVSMENLKEICHGHLPTTSFSALQELDLKYLPKFVRLWKEGTEGEICLVNLRNVSIHTCHKLQILFPLHTATDRGLLHYLCIFNCEILRGIFSDNIAISGEEVGEIVLPMLKTLELSLLPQLKTFCPTLNEISSSDDSHDMPLFGGNVKFPELQELILRELPRVKSLWHCYVSNC
ncbi:putative AAA+ ATPase domain, P-loop containing nucleoside triphosphate hydrolase [Helianthus annuus]|uniref:AAA+ ATPase domain, P-loop containing nucleoside triphosphate hydrolase n=1 Tax=Helianthus annuus TaxID=4232 RepID=A0A251TWD0_HELAN|nr:disease resistance protein At4g27190 [Helianthus annuus]KAF5791229.1 putative AAA+ ATPase domain, P-loop containing nucleoside triphosphate hydrolase [Helianthus annuus]KAJ0534744.1 putative AAA+ ATPase domain, P-loop containing nucleoside triphosphate hydrolase [Helianthus annuus]KAJ0888615.1 putative AAA+ ATPase domain, P-loop containing nucleoside triphosphate hydrolase [Helianthus annuus]KAJ0893494.1 putative AAA+ ATPase domain, P-loop containing nucleoside triphosphate hydrolase [Helian